MKLEVCITLENITYSSACSSEATNLIQIDHWTQQVILNKFSLTYKINLRETKNSASPRKIKKIKKIKSAN